MRNRVLKIATLLGALGVTVNADVLVQREWRDGSRGVRPEGSSADRARDRLAAAALSQTRRVPRFMSPAPSLSIPESLTEDVPSAPELLHGRELRDPIWAPAMEDSMSKTWLSRDVFAKLGLAEMNVTRLSCRQTTCLVEYEYPSRLERIVADAGLRPASPMVLVEEALGWAAPRGGGLTTTIFERQGEPMKRASLVLGFDEASWEPTKYAEWVNSQRPVTQAFYRDARVSLAKEKAASEHQSDRPLLLGDDAG